tara:strand:- start:511 stop:1008 length:498 start_codon:yes stop_codon:yes gene_type:complete
MSNINLDIEIKNEIYLSELELEKLVLNIFKLINLDRKTELNILLSNNKNIKNYNLKYRGIDEETDVLSFSPTFSGKYYGEKQKTNEEEIIFPENININPLHLGDIIISAEYVISKNKNNSIKINNEIKKLLLHGILHLNGYDHENDEDAKEMNNLTESIIKKLKL